MRIVGSYQYPTMESVIYGKPAAEALREEAERLGAKRVYLIVSRTLNTTTGEIEKISEALGARHAETFDGVPQHTTREVVVRVAKQAKDAKADLIVAIGGGSVVDAAKIVLMCMEHDHAGAALRTVPHPEGAHGRDSEHAVRRRIQFRRAGHRHPTQAEADLQSPHDDAAKHHPRSRDDQIHTGETLVRFWHPRHGSRYRGNLL
jgi:hypothetical protein